MVSSQSTDRTAAEPPGAEPQLAEGLTLPAFRHRYLAAAVGLLLLAHVALVFQCAVEDSVTYDEIGNLTAGLSYWETDSYQLYNVNPPLPKLLASLPVVLADPDISAIRLPKHPRDRPEWAVGERFAADNAARYHHLVVLARSVGLVWSVLGALGVYRWAKALWGQAGGVFALAVWCFEPNVIAHAHLLNVDLPATAAGLWAAYLFRGYLVSPSWTAACRAGVVLGTALLCKFTLLVFYPTWCLLWIYFVVRGRRTGEQRPGLGTTFGQLVVIFVASLFVINLGYEFAGTGKRLKEFRFVSRALAGPPADGPRVGRAGYGNRFEGTVFGEMIVPVPEDMVRGIDVQRWGAERNRQITNKYLRGEWSQTGWWYYYLYAVAVKVPLGVWGLLLFALAGRLWGGPSARLCRGEFLALWLPALAVFAFISSHPSMQEHLRYVLPAFPFVIVYMGRAGQALVGRPRVLRWVAGGLFVWAAGSYLSLHPHSLAYFNELAGGPDRGHEHLDGSNIDWGQDLLRLKRWLDEHPEAKPLKLAYFNHIDPRTFGIEFQLPPLGVTAGVPADPRAAVLLGPHPGYFAVSARFAYGAPLFAPDGAGRYHAGPPGSLEYFRQFQPVAKAGYSIYIYHITPEEADRVRQQYGLPPLPANWNGAPAPPGGETPLHERRPP